MIEGFFRIETVDINRRQPGMNCGGLESLNINKKNKKYKSKYGNNLIVCKSDVKKFSYPSMLYTNIRSIGSKFNELEASVAALVPDVVVVTETWIKSNQIDFFKLYNYREIHKIRTREDKSHGGGVSVYVKEGIHIQSYKLPDDLSIDVLTVVIKPSYLPRGTPWLAVIAVYIPPCDNKCSDISSYILYEIDRLLTINCFATIHVIGDFNTYDTSFIQRLPGFRQLISCPTRGNNILDLFFTNAHYNNEIIILPPVGDSDHNTIRIIPELYSTILNSKIYKMVRQKKGSNYKAMGFALSNFDWSTWERINDIQIASTIFHEFLCELFEACFPLIPKSFNSNSPPWISHQIVELINDRNSKYDKHNKNLTSLINKEIKQSINIAKRNYLTSLDNGSNINSQDFFQKLRTFFGIQKKSLTIKFQDMTIEESQSSIISYFQELANTHAPFDPKDLNLPYDENDFPRINVLQVHSSLSKLNLLGSAAPHDVPSFVYREYALLLAEPITHLINKSISEGTCPEIWKSSFMIPIPKVKCPLSPKDIRPISITSPIVKICERFILDHTLGVVSEYLDPLQFGGVPGRSIVQHISIFLDRVCRNVQISDNTVYTLITDYAKAFDNADHNIFFLNFLKMNPPSTSIKWIASFLYKRDQILRDNGSLEPLSYTCTNGIPQGTVLGPFIFAVIVNYVARSIPGSQKYVDDLVVTSEINKRSTLLPQSIFDQIQKESMEIGLPLNEAKCTYVVFDFKKVKTPISFQSDAGYLEQSVSFCLLGITIQDNLKWDCHIHNMIMKANKKMCLLYYMRKIGMSCDSMKLVYISMIRSILEYGVPIWHSSLQ